jgi:LysM repeat protein
MKIISFLILLFSVPAFAQKQATIDEYIAAYKQFAIDEQVRTGIPAAITLAQAIHESGAGIGDLACKSNNHFGIKCKNTWTGDVVFHDDDSAGECFRSYPCVADSYRDHSDFLRTGKRYAFLFDIPPTDYTAWAEGLKQAGYATNPRYSAIIAKIIEDNNLEELTETALVQSGNTIWLSASKTSSSQNNSVDDAIAKTNREVVFQKKITDPLAVKPIVIKVNRCKAIQAPAGSSLKKIALLFDKDYTDLLDYNDMKTVDKLAVSQIIFLEEKRKKGGEKTHTVQKGESAWLISQLEGIQLKRLLGYNDLKVGTALKAGQTLKLR